MRRLARVLALTFLGLPSCRTDRTLALPDTLEFATRPLAVRRNDVHLTCLEGERIERTIFVALDGGEPDPSTRSPIAAFLASPRTCIVQVEPWDLWNEFPYVEIELERTPEGWRPVTCGLLDQPDFFVDRDPDEFRWFHPRVGEIVVDGTDPDVNAPIRCSFRLRIPQDEDVGDIVLVANFEVTPKPLPSERPPVVQQFIEDARVSERW